MVLSVTFFDSGIRAIRTVESRSPSPSYNDTEAQLASRYPPPPVFIGAITPSSETATVHAVSATSSVSSRTLASNWGRCASQRAESALGSRSSELFEGVMLPNTPNTSSTSRGNQVSGQHRALTRRMRRPVPFDDAYLALHRSDRPLARGEPDTACASPSPGPPRRDRSFRTGTPR